MTDYIVTHAKHNGKENRDFALCRPHGLEEYLFLHFKTPTVFILCGTTYLIEPGMCIILSPRTPHGFHTDGCELNHDWMHFMPKVEQKFLDLNLVTNAFFHVVDTGFITSVVKRCECELIYKKEAYENMISAEITAMFVRLKRLISEDNCGYHTDVFKNLRFDIYRHPKRYPGVESMADVVNLSRSRFSVLYKQCFGVAPKHDLITSRISKASYLLSIGTLSLAEIAEECGYQNIYHFIRQFRTVVGIPPGMYRKNIDK